MKCSATILVFMVACCGCGKTDPETLVRSGYDEQEMEAAIERARREVDTFIAELSNPTGDSHAVKAPIQDGGETEHFWLTDVAFRDGQFEGTIDNEPGMVKNVKIGQKWTVKKMEISDWMFMRGDKIYGNYTVRPLLKTMSKSEAEKMRSLLAEP